ncbi:hypothetical protein L3Q82_006645 [Scortum barcoo]|uniref:Uncharacterized protein n=1 Tax=Scortum barcoo TaxID=214431 RepID=A0ACB8X0F3_9TELE|nr:hypothetical protein L3Q82_006645 [Scortum barcoo]
MGLCYRPSSWGSDSQSQALLHLQTGEEGHGGVHRGVTEVRHNPPIVFAGWSGAGFFFVGKKDGSLWPCIDYSALNDITVKNRHPLPLISSAFEQLQQAKIFTKLDLRNALPSSGSGLHQDGPANAYHLVRIRERDEWKTGVNTPTRYYEYLVMPFGLTNAPAIFQGFINEILREFLNDFVFVYLDDILISSPDPVTHQHHVRQVLIRLLEHQLYVKAEKCEFHASSVSFLGFIVTHLIQIKRDPEKVSAVTNWPPPTSRKKLQQFLGFANFYRKFIRNFSAAPWHGTPACTNLSQSSVSVGTQG